MRKGVILLLLVSALFGNVKAQRGEKSIAAGLLFAFPSSVGVGLEGLGQYNFTEKSAALLELQLTSFIGHIDVYSYGRISTSLTSLSLKGGSRYQFILSGFYANVLAGV